MSLEISEILFIIGLIMILPSFIVVSYNLITAPKLNNEDPGGAFKEKVSVLIPARNEEMNIANAVRGALNQSHGNIEVIVLDDHSSDGTPLIVREFMRGDNRVKLLEGGELPAGWLGKNWACHQLSGSASGDILLFVDADVQLNRHALKQALNMMINRKLSLLSSFPTQNLKSFGEWLVVPMMNWLLLSFLPLKKVLTSPNKSFIAANGQFIMIRRGHYDDIGGHAAVKNALVEDMEMARLTKKDDKKMMTVLGSTGVECRMYDGFGSAFNGFKKNFFAGFNTSVPAFIFMLSYFFAVFLLPFLLVPLNFNFIWLVLIILFLRFLLSVASRQNFVLNVLLHPLQMIIMLAVGINSVVAYKFNRLEWKGRKI